MNLLPVDFDKDFKLNEEKQTQEQKSLLQKEKILLYSPGVGPV
jgi:hypothetical protein